MTILEAGGEDDRGNSYDYFSIGSDASWDATAASGYDSLVSALLTALAAGKQVTTP